MKPYDELVSFGHIFQRDVFNYLKRFFPKKIKYHGLGHPDILCYVDGIKIGIECKNKTYPSYMPPKTDVFIMKEIKRDGLIGFCPRTGRLRFVCPLFAYPNRNKFKSKIRCFSWRVKSPPIEERLIGFVENDIQKQKDNFSKCIDMCSDYEMLNGDHNIILKRGKNVISGY